METALKDNIRKYQKGQKSILFQINAKWEESLNDTVNFDQMKTCFRLRVYLFEI